MSVDLTNAKSTDAFKGFPSGSAGKESTYNIGDWVQSLGWGDTLARSTQGTPGQVKGMLGRLAAGGRTTLLCVLGRPLDRPGRTAINLPGLLPGSMFGRVRHTVPSFSACQHDCRPEAALSTLATEVSLYHHFTLVLLDTTMAVINTIFRTTDTSHWKLAYRCHPDPCLCLHRVLCVSKFPLFIKTTIIMN